MTGLDYCFLCSRQLAPDHTHDVAPTGMNLKTRLSLAAGVAWWIAAAAVVALLIWTAT